MRSSTRVLREGLAVFTVLLAGAGCATAPGKSAACRAADRGRRTRRPSGPPTRSRSGAKRRSRATSSARALLRRGGRRRSTRGRARPRTGSQLAFSFELWDGIQRYEALAGATEEAGTSHGQVSPELEAIEAPDATPEEISAARAEVASAPTVSSDVPVVVNDSVLRVLAAFQSDGLHDKIAAGLSRSGRYVPMIQQIFAEEGLPQDLAWIAFIESSFLPHARSPKAAHGIWQFMPRTGRQYGLKSNGIVDERSDPEKATRAAAKYLTYLHEIFGDWYLVMAAYNAGEGKILRAMEKTGARDFWQLAGTSAIRRQTQNYVPAFLASVLISKDPTHYGFDVVLEPPIAFETVRLDRPVDLGTLAGGADLSLEELQALNPELRSVVTPRQDEGYELKVPQGTRETVLLAFQATPTAKPPTFTTHVAKKGETLPRIAKRYGVSVTALASANSLSTKLQGLARPGDPHPAEGRDRLEDEEDGEPARSTKAAAAPAPAPKSYKVKSGDTLYRIALHHGVTVAEILAINSLGGTPSLKAGDQLAIPAKGK